MQSIMVYLLATDKGLGTLGAEIARQPNKVAQFAGSIISLRLILSFIFAVPFLSCGFIANVNGDACAGQVLGSYPCFQSEFAFQGSQRMCGISMAIFSACFYLVLIFVIISGQGNSVVPLLRFVAEAITLILIGVWLLRRHEQIPVFTWKPHIWYGYLRESLMMAALLCNQALLYLRYNYAWYYGSARCMYQAGYKIIILLLVQLISAICFCTSLYKIG